jgi:hypothetical protein
MVVQSVEKYISSVTEAQKWVRKAYAQYPSAAAPQLLDPKNPGRLLCPTCNVSCRASTTDATGEVEVRQYHQASCEHRREREPRHPPRKLS